MSNLSVIIPIHKFDSEISNYLLSAVDSVLMMDYDKDIVIVGPEAILKDVKKAISSVPVSISYVANENSDYCTQVNVAVSKISSPYFCVLEFDDHLSPTWATNVGKYTEEQHDGTSIYLPIIQNFDVKKDEDNFAGFTNEVGWARGFTEDELGYITKDALLAYFNYGLSGAIIKTKDFIEFGGLKPSIKLFFWYEYMLRVTDNGGKIFVVPKVGCFHAINRDDSMIKNYENNLPSEEAEWWLKTSQEEYLYKEDRNPVYGA